MNETPSHPSRSLFAICVWPVMFAVGCSQQSSVDVLKSRTSPDGRWVIAAEFKYSGSEGYEILRDANGVEVARTDGALVDLPHDYFPEGSDLFITNESAGRTFSDGRSVELWHRDATTDFWRPTPPKTP